MDVSVSQDEATEVIEGEGFGGGITRSKRERARTSSANVGRRTPSKFQHCCMRQ